MAEYLENIWQTDLLPGQPNGTRSSCPSPRQLVLPLRYLQHGVFTSWDQSTDGITWTSGGQGIVVSPPGGYLTLRDALLLGTLGQRFMGDGGDWDDRAITLSLNDCVRAMGYTTTGGKQRRQAADSIRRLTAALLTREQSGVDGKGRPVTLRFDWHILDANQTRISATEGGVRVRLSLETVALLGGGMLKFLTAKTARDLVKADEVAARLWFFLESERLKDAFTYHVLRPSEPAPGQSYIAEVVGISHWQSKRKIKARIAKAVKEIELHDDGRYGLHLRTNKTGVTFLQAMRTSRRELKSRR